jgi:hypothetical protein
MYIRSLLFSSLVLIFTACGKSPPTNASQLTCKINGNNFTATQASIDYNSDIQINARNLSYKIMIEVNSYDINSYDLAIPQNDILLVDLATGTGSFTNHEFSLKGSGSLEITEITEYTYNKSMSGNFSFIVYNFEGDSTVVTDGIFNNVPYE